MSLQSAQAYGGLIASRQINETNNAMMGAAVLDGQRAEILVQRDQNPPFLVGTGQYRFITGISGPIARPDYIVPGLSQYGHHKPGYACIKQDFHAETSSRGSIRSRATTIRA